MVTTRNTLKRLISVGFILWPASVIWAEDDGTVTRTAHQATPQSVQQGTFTHSAGVLPTDQSPPGWNHAIAKKSIAQLKNPFQDAPARKRGLLGSFSSQASPQSVGVPASPQFAAPIPPPVPYAPEAAPGVVTAPSEGAIAPGFETAPGMDAELGTLATPETGAETGMPGTPETSPPGGVGSDFNLPQGAEDAFAAAEGMEGPGFGGAAEAASRSYPMFGDRGPLFQTQAMRFPPIPSPLPPGVPRPGVSPAGAASRAVAAVVPAVRGFKIADNQYPRPIDRVWVSFNYFDGVNSGINRALQAPINGMQVYSEIFGIEKTFWDKQASIGFRIPVNTLTIGSPVPGFNGSSTSTGNFSSFFKYAFYADEKGNLLSAGIDMTFPTGPKSFAGFPSLLGINAFELQPFLGYIFMQDNYFVQGFTSVAVPMDRRLATMWYGDIALGYFLYRSQNPRAFISSIVPAFETHLNIPLNWAGLQPQYIGSTPHVVDLTFGVNMGIMDRAVLSAGYVRPVTGPLPFNGEFALMLNIPFGGRPGGNIPLTPPVF